MDAEKFFTPSFLRAVKENTEASFRSIMAEPRKGLYTFEMLQPQFCEMLMSEVSHFFLFLFCIFLLFSSHLWSGIFFLFLFSPNLWLGIFFFCFLPILDRELSFFVLFSSEGKVYGELGFWLKTCSTIGHDICQSVGLTSGSGIKGMSHIISMIHMQHRWLGNFMQNWSCTHPCRHSSI